MFPLSSKGAKKLNFTPITVSNLFKFCAQESDLANFETKVKIPSEIKPTLEEEKNQKKPRRTRKPQ